MGLGAPAASLFPLVRGPLTDVISRRQKLGLPVSTVQMIQGSILIFVAAGGMFTKYRIVRKERRLGND